MSRIIISNNESKFHILVQRSIQAGLVVSSQQKWQGIYFASFYKRVKRVENFYKDNDENFAISSGTLLFDGDIGRNALKGVLNTSSQLDELRENLSGNYTVAMAHQGKVSVFCDPYAIHDVYYFQEEGDYAICNSLIDLACIKKDLSVNKSGLISETLLSGYIGNESMFQNIFKLRGVEELILGRNDFKIIRHKYECREWDFVGMDIDCAVRDYANLLRAQARNIRKAWPNVGLHQTGGLDSRLIFSALMAEGIRPKLLYGKGNSILTTTNKEDLDCVLDYANRFKLDLHLMNWSNRPTGESHSAWKGLFNRYGLKYAIYGASASFFSEYEGNIPDYPDFFEFGYYGENLRLREYLSGRDSVPLDEFFESYLFGGGGGYGDLNKVSFLPDGDCIKEELRNQYMLEAEFYGLKPDGPLTKMNFDRFRWVHARRADSRSVNLINEFAPSFALLSTPALHELPWSLPAVWREGAEFQLRVINELHPEALEASIFSHGSLQHVDRSTFKIEKKHTLNERIKDILRSVGAGDKFIRTCASIYHRYFQSDKEAARLIELNQVTSEQASHWVYKFLDEECHEIHRYVNARSYPGHIVGLYRYALHIYAFQNFLDDAMHVNKCKTFEH